MYEHDNNMYLEDKITKGTEEESRITHEMSLIVVKQKCVRLGNIS